MDGIGCDQISGGFDGTRSSFYGMGDPLPRLGMRPGWDGTESWFCEVGWDGTRGNNNSASHGTRTGPHVYGMRWERPYFRGMGWDGISHGINPHGMESKIFFGDRIGPDLCEMRYPDLMSRLETDWDGIRPLWNEISRPDPAISLIIIIYFLRYKVYFLNIFIFFLN